MENQQIPAMKVVVDWSVLVEGLRIQISTDLHILSCQESHASLIFILKDLPLQRRYQQQQAVIWSKRNQKIRVIHTFLLEEKLIKWGVMKLITKDEGGVGTHGVVW